MIRRVVVPVACVVLLSSCAARKAESPPPPCPQRDTHERLNGVLWMQTSAEYKALAAMTYRQATEAVRELVKSDRKCGRVPSAALEQQGEVRGRNQKLAVIVDLDETVLDNAAMSAELVEQRAPFTPEAWTCWVDQKEAGFVEGARRFIGDVERLGVEVLYVTNRTKAEKARTIENLDPFRVEERHLLTSGEIDPDTGKEWESEKEGRRRYLAKRYWIIAMVGDDLADFIPGIRGAAPTDRIDMMKEHEGRFGDTWFLLPNPVYGSWETVLFAREDKDAKPKSLSEKDAKQLRDKIDKVEGFIPADYPPGKCPEKKGTPPIPAPTSTPQS